MKNPAIARPEQSLHPLQTILPALILLSTACGGRVELDSSATEQDAIAACPECSHHWFGCARPGFESVDFQAESQNTTGCTGYIYASQGAAPPWAGPYTIICDPPQMCDAELCAAVALTENSFAWGMTTCRANSP